MPSSIDQQPLSIQSVDSSPKWFTEVEIDRTQAWMDSSIEYMPTVVFDETPFARVEFHQPEVRFIPGPTLGA
jgi:hypothetical protein